MKIQTAQNGTVEITKHNVIKLKPGLLGLEQYTKFILLHPDEKLPFVYLQSTEEPDICLLLANPFEFYPDYQFDLTDEDIKELNNPSEENISVWVTVTARGSLKDATINLLAPLIINLTKNIGKQVVLQSTNYLTRTPLFNQMKEGA